MAVRCSVWLTVPSVCFRVLSETSIKFADPDKHQEQFSEYPELNELMANRETGAILRPTNTFGQFETPFSPVVSQVNAQSA